MLVPELSYKDLDIGDGDNAMAAFAFMAQNEISNKFFSKFRNDLLKYCKLDTFAMVKLHEKLCGYQQVRSYDTMDKTIALSLYMARDYLKKVLPTTLFKDIHSIFEESYDVVSSDINLSSYANKVQMTYRGDAFSEPTSDPIVLETVKEALYKQKKFWAYYQNRHNHDDNNKKYFVNPLGLVYRSNIAYLVCTLWDRTNVIHLALHRMREPKIAPVDVVVPESFDLNEHIEAGSFKYISYGDEQKINLRAILSSDAAVYFKERPDSFKTLKDLGNNQVELEADVVDSLELRHILLGFGYKIQVLEPAYLRNELHKLMLYDPLTGLLNRGEFDFRLEYEIKRHSRENQNFTLLLLDIDHFKLVNDTYGHLDGDEVLKELSKRIQNSIREVDYAFRYGGEEFAIILPGSKSAESLEVAERIRLGICNTNFLLPNSKSDKNITVSIGLAEYSKNNKDKEADSLKSYADKMLYLAKDSGRNCIKCQ